MNRVDVAVVGAGIAGLRVADRLVAAGRSIAVLEARDRLGGRLLSHEGIDLGASWFWPNEPRVRALIEELGVDTHPQFRSGDAVYEDPRGVRRLEGNPIDVESGRFSGGAASLATALANRLPEGTVRTTSPVTSVRVRGTGSDTEPWSTASTPAGIELGGPSIELHADRAVLALPPALAVERIHFDPPLPEDLARLAAATPVWMGATTKVVAVYDRPFWREAGLAGAGVSHRGPLREIHDLSGPGGRAAALFGFAAPLDQWAPGDPEGQVARQLVTLFGRQAASPEQLHIVDWSRERWTVPSRPASPDRFDLYGHPAWRSPTHGRLHWASTETSPAFGGHIEGALLAADLAVEALLGSGPGT